MKTAIKKQDIKKQVERLHTAWHELYGYEKKHYGLNVKIRNFEDPIQKFLWDAFDSGLYEENLIARILEKTTSEFRKRTGKNLYETGRNSGYWGFIVNKYDTEKNIQKTMKQLRISLTNSLYSVFNHETYFIERGIFFGDGTDIFLNVGLKNFKYIVEMWGAKSFAKYEKEFEKKLNENFERGIKELDAFWNDFATAYRMKDLICNTK